MKLVRERKTDTVFSLSDVESKTKTKTKLIDSENRLLVARGRWEKDVGAKWVKGIKSYRLLVRN